MRLIKTLIWNCGALVVLALRMPDWFTTPQFFCEDGTVFFVDAFNLGSSSLFKPYAGYLPFYQRLVAWLASGVPIANQPACYLTGAVAIYLVVVNYSLSSRCVIGYRPLAAVLFLMAPFDGTVILNLTNSQWLLAFLFLLVIISPSPASQTEAAVDYLLISIAALTGPFSVIFLPVVGMRMIFARSPHASRLFVLTFAAALIQMLIMADHPLERSSADPRVSFDLWFQATVAIVARFPALLTSPRLGGVHQPAFYLVVVVILWGILLSWAVCRGSSSVVMLCASAVAITIVTLLLYRGDPEALLYRPRYAFIPYMALICSLVQFVQASQHRVLLSALLFGAVVLNSRESIFPEALADLNWGIVSQCIGQGEECQIPINWNNRSITYMPHKSNKGSLRNSSDEN